MKRLCLGGLVSALLAAALVFSQNPLTTGSSSSALKVEVGDRNPWTHLKLNNDPGDFQFVVVSDRTGGHREKIFSRAVEQIIGARFSVPDVNEAQASELRHQALSCDAKFGRRTRSASSQIAVAANSWI